MCMKFKKLSLLDILEQHDEFFDDDFFDDNDDFENEPNGEQPDDNEELPNPNIVRHPDDTEDGTANNPKPQKAKPLSPIQRIKMRWKEESPGLADGDMNGAIESFNNRKNNLRPLSDNPEVRNMPEILSLKQRFPEFPANDIQKLKDIQSYTWQQIEFFLDRFSEADAMEALDWNITGDTPEERKQSAENKWKKTYNKIFDENGLTVHRIDAKDEAIALGKLQQILCAKYGGQIWCVTYAPGDVGNNLYSSYRTRRSFYFIMDKNRKENDNHYISSIGVVDPSTSNYRNELNYVITPRENGDNVGLQWADLVKVWPGLANSQNIFKYFGPTLKEKTDVTLDRITFRAGDPNDFAVQSPRIQKIWIDSNRTINEPRAFLTMNEGLQHEYVARATLDDYKNRFKSNDTAKPFAMLDALSKGDLRFLDQIVLKTQLKIADGIYAIKANVLKTNYKVSYSDAQNKNIMMFSSRYNNNIFGVMDLSNLKWIKPISYLQGKATTLIDRASRKLYILRRYSSDDGSDYFYWLFNQKDLTDKNSPTYLKGTYYDGKGGDELMTKYQKLA